MARSSTPFALRLRLPPGPGPASSRLAAELVRAIAAGHLHDGDPLPSTRSLAAGIGVARSTVVAAYDELAVGGYLWTRPGSMTLVAEGAEEASRTGAYPPVTASGERTGPTVVGRHDGPRPVYDLAPGYPDVALINFRSWEGAWRRTLRRARQASPYSMPVYDGAMRRDLQPHLRRQLCDHLRRHRGIACAPDDVFLSPDISTVLGAIVEVLGRSSTTVAFEDPGYITARRALGAFGCAIRPHPVGDGGLSAADLETDTALVYVTPAHQHPLGVTMTLDRRRALLDWAQRTGALIVEDDHDGQFGHHGPPVAPIRSLARSAEHVIHVGMIGRVLNHELKLTWAVIPTRLRSRFREYYMDHGNALCELSASAVAEFVADGALTRHLASSSRVYSARRTAFVAACRAQLPRVEVVGAGAGLHALLDLGAGRDDMAVAEDLRARGLDCLPLGPFYHAGSRTPRRSGLVCGYGRLPQTLAPAAVRVIAETLDSLGPRR